MGRMVKIWDTGGKASSDVSYRAPNGKYYSTKEAYDSIHKISEERQECVNLLLDIFGYESGMKPNTFLFKGLNELKEYGYDVVYETILSERENIERILTNKRFENEIGKIRYIYAIINNNIMDIYQKKQDEIRQNRRITQVVNARDYQRGLEETKEGYDIRGTTGERNNVSKFLGDFE